MFNTSVPFLILNMHNQVSVTNIDFNLSTSEEFEDKVLEFDTYLYKNTWFQRS